jgi:hypothetical protein
MPKSSSFLNLVLPEYSEFVDSWHDPVNQNTESIDEWLEDLYNGLVLGAVPLSSTWATLRGNLTSLAERLNVSLDADGNVDVSNAQSTLDTATSAYRGDYPGPRERLNDGDELIFDASQPVAGGRFAPIPSGGPSAGFPPEDLDAGIALRSADFGAEAGSPLGSPMKPSAPGMVIGGNSSLLSGVSAGVLRLAADVTPAVFNIDGYVFRIREQIDVDYSNLAPAGGEYIWVFVSRNETGVHPYDGAFTYNQDGGYATKDLRRRQEGGDGVSSGAVFTSSSAKFTTAILGKVKSGDLLVVNHGGAIGEVEYAIDAIDGTLTDTKLTIRGTFAADASGLSWHIYDPWMPNIGAVVTDGNADTEPPYEPGRVYVGRIIHNGGGPGTSPIDFAKCGVDDSGWLPVTAAGIDGSPYSYDHNLGAIPTSVEVMFRETGGPSAYQPVVERPIVTKMATGNFPDPVAGDTNTEATMLLPSARWQSTNTTVTVRLLNTVTDPAIAPALFTDGAGSDVVAGDMRIIVRR